MEKSPVRKIGKYEIISKVAEGGMGSLYKARHPTLDRVVLLKKLTLRGGSQFIERFKREARIMMDIKNDRIVQVYDHDEAASLARPPRELKAFAKVALQPGESKTVRFSLDRRAFAFYDPYRKDWVVEPGRFEILVGSSSRAIRTTAAIELIMAGSTLSGC